MSDAWIETQLDDIAVLTMEQKRLKAEVDTLRELVIEAMGDNDKYTTENGYHVTRYSTTTGGKFMPPLRAFKEKLLTPRILTRLIKISSKAVEDMIKLNFLTKETAEVLVQDKKLIPASIRIYPKNRDK